MKLLSFLFIIKLSAQSKIFNHYYYITMMERAYLYLPKLSANVFLMLLTYIHFNLFQTQELSFKISNNKESETASFNDIKISGTLSSSSNFVPLFLRNHLFSFQISGTSFESIVLDFDLSHPYLECSYEVSIY